MGRKDDDMCESMCHMECVSVMKRCEIKKKVNRLEGS